MTAGWETAVFCFVFFVIKIINYTQIPNESNKSNSLEILYKSNSTKQNFPDYKIFYALKGEFKKSERRISTKQKKI